MLMSGSFYCLSLINLLVCIYLLHQPQGLSNLLKTNPEKGISGDDDDLLQRKTIYGSNTYPRKKGKGFLV